MRELRSCPPTPRLRPFVRAFAQRRTAGASDEQGFPAHLESIIEFDFGDLPSMQSTGRERLFARVTNFGGPRTVAPATLHLSGDIDSFAIFLRPTAPWSLFHIRVSDLAESRFDADDVLGRRVVHLCDALASTTDFAARVQITETFLSQFLDRQTADTTATIAARRLSVPSSQIDIATLALSLHISIRHLERIFSSEFGLTPKRFARVARFQHALDTRIRSPHRTWSDIAATSGYHDQMHLVHDFRALGGMSPTATIEHLGDSRPDALANESE